jgi:hypothetical protein
MNFFKSQRRKLVVGIEQKKNTTKNRFLKRFTIMGETFFRANTL